MQAMSKCCSNGPISVLPLMRGDKTCKINAGAIKIFNSYVLNKQQVFKAGNTINYADTKVIQGLGKDAVRKQYLIQIM